MFCGETENYYVQNVKNQSLVQKLQEDSTQRTVEPMNLLVFMIDTVSRAQVFRKMPFLSSFFEEIHNSKDFEVFQFFRLMSNGFNTEYNTRAMYTGSQLRQERSGRPYWDLMRNQGNAALYLNGFCEDWMSTFLKTEFKGADHSVFFPWCHFEYHPLEKTFGNFAGPFSILRRCINGKHVHNYIFDYLKQFYNNYPNFGKVAHIPLQEGHEGTGEVILTLDPDLTSYLNHLKETGQLNKTVVILTSDHGSHMGPYFMATEMGDFEQKLPFLFMLFPNWFLEKYPSFKKNLLENEQQLVGHYDTYWTMKHLATLPEFGGEIKENFSRESNQFVAVWDCQKNLHYMEVAWAFKDKFWKKEFHPDLVSSIYTRIQKCFDALHHQPQLHTEVSSVPLEEVRTLYSEEGPTVEKVIKDTNAKYWFEDAYQDLSKEMMLRGTAELEVSQEYLEKNLELEDHSWNTLQAPGRGRYLFGRSLLKHSNPRNCSQTGIVKCICNNNQGTLGFLSDMG